MEIGQVLLNRGLLNEQQLQMAQQESNGVRVDQAAVSQGWISEEDALTVLADELGLRYVRLKDLAIDRDLLASFPMSIIFRNSLIPINQNNGHVEVAVSDPFDMESLDELSSYSGKLLRPVLACRNEIDQSIKQHLGVGGDTINELVAQQGENDIELLQETDEQSGELAEIAQEASVIRLVNELLIEALQQSASDVHIEPKEHGLDIRYRVDGLLRVQPVSPGIAQFFSAIVTRLKIMAHLNIAEKRLPQDGRIKLRVSGREIDVRVSVIPMLYGEGIVLRLLDRSRMQFNLSGVGMPEEINKPFRELISQPHGIVLVTGPTGSGKTSTLYSALAEIKDPSTKIITVEDPVEYHTEGISQIQVHSRIGLTFAEGLRSILRHDPDVVLIGEIRDGETAQSAIQASLTGHLVFSTLHTNDSAGAFTRLIDMGVEPYLVASTVEGVLAQRLLRTLCPNCKESYRPADDEWPPDFPQPLPEQIWRAPGCRQCGETGYAGRTGIFELLVADPVVRRLCVERADASQIRDYCVRHGLITLRQSGWQKVIAGDTSIEEVLRVTKGDEI